MNINVSEIVATVFQSPILYIATLIVLFILVKTGVLNIHTKALTVGLSRDSERAILRNQIEYAQTFCRGMLRNFPEDEKKFRQLYIIEMIFNEVVSIIAFNHINIGPEYIKVKKEKIWNIASTVEDIEIYQTDEFRSFIFERVEKLIKDLYEIRKIGQRSQ